MYDPANYKNSMILLIISIWVMFGLNWVLVVGGEACDSPNCFNYNEYIYIIITYIDSGCS